MLPEGTKLILCLNSKTKNMNQFKVNGKNYSLMILVVRR